jgi:hypothetical protein
VRHRQQRLQKNWRVQRTQLSGHDSWRSQIQLIRLCLFNYRRLQIKVNYSSLISLLHSIDPLVAQVQRRGLHCPMKAAHLA